MNSVKILVIDDEEQIRKFLHVALQAHQYCVIEALSGKEGMAYCASYKPHMVILDLSLPDIDGQMVLTKLREWYEGPVIILSARDDEENIVQALDNGASDYIKKPFSLPELLARIKVALRHSNKQFSEPILQFEHLQIDFAAHRVYFYDKEISLTATEFNLLKLFANNAGKILTHGQILKTVWGPKAEEHRHYLRIYVGHLRHKIEENPSNPQLIINEPGVGYRFGS